MEQQKPVKIEISGKLSYSDDITLNQAAQIIAFIDSSSNVEMVVPAQATRLSPVTLTASTARTGSNPREVLDSTRAKTNPQKIVAFASIVLDEGKNTFTLEDVKPLFRRAREATPKNISRDLDAAVRSGWVADADEKGEYFLTKKALDALEAGFSSGQADRATSAPRRSSSSSKPRKTPMEIPEVFKDIDPIPGTIGGVIPYVKLKSDQDRFLWVIKMAKDLKIDGLSNQEIVWVTDRLGSGIPTKQISSKFNNARNQGRVNRSTATQKIRITEDGEEYLKTIGAAKD